MPGGAVRVRGVRERFGGVRVSVCRASAGGDGSPLRPAGGGFFLPVYVQGPMLVSR